MKGIFTFIASALIIVLTIISSKALAQDNDLQFGNHKVGFKYVYLLDKTRDWVPSPFDSLDKPKTTFRPMRIAIWYPAETESKGFMKFKNYINPEAPDKYFGKLNEIMNTYDMWSYNGMFDKNKSIINSLLDLNTNSLFNAKEKPGKFPLVLYCCGWFSRSPDNSLMAEYLASHGYIVVTVPQLGTGSTIFDFKVTEDRTITQLQDLQFALNYALTLNNVDKDKIASLGFSIGGIVQLWLSQQDLRIKAFVALDGSFMFKEWEDLANKGIRSPTRNIPLLSLYRGNEKLAANISTGFFNKLSGTNKLLVEVPKATHGEFSDEAYLYSQMNYPWKHTKYNTLEEATNCYRSVIRLTEAFLNLVFSPGDGKNIREAMKENAKAMHLQFKN